MPSDKYYFNEGSLTVTLDDGTTVTVGEARGVSMTAAADHNRFTGPDSIKRQEKKRSNFRVNVDIEIAEFDDDFLAYWLNADGTKGTTVADSNDVQNFNVTAEQPMSSGDFKLTATAIDTDFEEMPALDGTEDEYESLSMTGEANDILWQNESV